MAQATEVDRNRLGTAEGEAGSERQQDREHDRAERIDVAKRVECEAPLVGSVVAAPEGDDAVADFVKDDRRHEARQEDPVPPDDSRAEAATPRRRGSDDAPAAMMMFGAEKAHPPERQRPGRLNGEGEAQSMQSRVAGLASRRGAEIGLPQRSQARRCPRRASSAPQTLRGRPAAVRRGLRPRRALP